MRKGNVERNTAYPVEKGQVELRLYTFDPIVLSKKSTKIFLRVENCLRKKPRKPRCPYRDIADTRIQIQNKGSQNTM